MSVERQRDHVPTLVDLDTGEVLEGKAALSHLEDLSRRVPALRKLAMNVREASRALLTEEDTFDPGDNTREPERAGYANLARAFGIETWHDRDDIQVTWEPNELYLRAVKEGWEDKLGKDVPKVPEHCTAYVTVHGVAPWGLRISRTRVASTRGEDLFWRSGGCYNHKKWKGQAVKTVTGTAATRATNAVVKDLLAFTRQQPDEEGEKRSRRRRERNEEEDRRFTLQQQWKRELARVGATHDQETAFYRLAPKLPDREEDFDADDYERALDYLARRGDRVFVKAERHLEENGEPPPTCPDCGTTVEGNVCPECGWDRHGPPGPDGDGESVGRDGEDTEDGSDGGGHGSGASEPTQGGDGSAGGGEPAEDPFAQDLKENPIKPAPEDDGDPPGPPPGDSAPTAAELEARRQERAAEAAGEGPARKSAAPGPGQVKARLVNALNMVGARHNQENPTGWIRSQASVVLMEELDQEEDLQLRALEPAQLLRLLRDVGTEEDLEQVADVVDVLEEGGDS